MGNERTSLKDFTPRPNRGQWTFGGDSCCLAEVSVAKVRVVWGDALAGLPRGHSDPFY